MTTTETDKPQHTPLPWDYGYENAMGDIHIGTLDQIVCTLPASPQTRSNKRLIYASVNAFDSAAKRLGVNAVELAERMQEGGIYRLIETLEDVAEWLKDGSVDGVYYDTASMQSFVDQELAKVKP
jgi:hypothetical protein